MIVTIVDGATVTGETLVWLIVDTGGTGQLALDNALSCSIGSESWEADRAYCSVALLAVDGTGDTCSIDEL